MLVAVGTGDGSVLLVEAATGIEQFSAVGHVAQVCSVALSPDGSLLASAGDDRCWNLWDVVHKKQRICSRIHDGRGKCSCTVRPGRQMLIDAWCPEWLHAPGVTTVSFSPCIDSGAKLATGGRVVTVWDAETGNTCCVRQWPRESGSPLVAFWGLQAPAPTPSFWSDVHSLSFTPDGLLLAGGKFGDGSIFVWNASTGALVSTLPGQHRRWLHSVVFCPQGRFLAAAGGDSVLRIFDADSQGATASAPNFDHRPRGAWHSALCARILYTQAPLLAPVEACQ